MRRLVTAVLLLTTVGCPLAYAAGASNYVMLNKFYSLYYPAPAAWSCKDKKGCVECENISAGETLVYVTLQPSGTGVQYSIPVGTTVKSCGDVLFVPGNVPVL